MSEEGSGQDYGALDDGDQDRHLRKSVPAEIRMALNGESEEQMQHAQAIKDAGGVSLNPEDGNDTSRDQDWELDESCSARASDTYIKVTSVIWLAPKFIVLLVPTLILHILPVLIVAFYGMTLRTGTERAKRSCYFYLVFFVAAIFSLPVIPLVVISLTYDYVGYYIFSVAYCAFTCRWANLRESLRKIQPYRNGPSFILKAPDLFIAVMGQLGRQTICETIYMVSMMWLLMPWLKYYVCCNPWLHDLDHRLCQQISTKLDDCGTLDNVAARARNIISRALQPPETARRLDSWSFVPHYPYPPPNRRWALGLQAGGGKYPVKFTLIVHTTHALYNAGGSTEQFVLSNSCAKPVYRVMLWYSNPFHFLTGWVEASLSTGLPSQPDKHHGGEHPMWLVTSRTPLVSGRDSMTGSGFIDAFFDYWLPVFVFELRYSHFADQYRREGRADWHEAAMKLAHDKYQEVHSQDGVSRPMSQIGLGEYRETGKETTFEVFQARERNRICEIEMASLADSGCGGTIRAWQEGPDLHGQLDFGSASS